MWLCHWVVDYLSFDFTLVTAQLHFLISLTSKSFAFKDWCLPKMGGISAACYRNPRVGDPHCLTDGWSQKSLVLYCSLSSSHYYRRSLQAVEAKSQNMERAEEKPVKVGARETQKIQNTNWMTWAGEPIKVDANVIQKKYKKIGRRE